MNCTDSGAGLHSYDRLDAHGHIDDDTVTLANTERLEAVGKLAYAAVKIPISGPSNLAIVCLENDGDFIGLSNEMPIKAVV